MRRISRGHTIGLATRLRQHRGLVAALAVIAGASALAHVAEAQTPKQSVTPIVECRELRADGAWVWFGYVNEWSAEITIPVSAGDNKITPAPQDRGQVTVFSPGNHQRVFAVQLRNAGNHTWHLHSPDGKTRTATASASTSLCETTTTTSSTTSTTTTMPSPPTTRVPPDDPDVIDPCAWGGPNVIYGSETVLTVTGTDGDDIICGGPGNNVIHGLGGSDRIFGEEGDDVIYGGSGIDLIEGGDGRDTIEGEADRDEIAGGLGDDLIVGGDGDDWLQGNEGGDDVRGEAGKDYVLGADGDDLLDGGIDNDNVAGGPGTDSGDAGDGVDRCTDVESVTSCEDGPAIIGANPNPPPLPPAQYGRTTDGRVEVPVAPGLTIDFDPSAATARIGQVDARPIPIEGRALAAGMIVGYDIDEGGLAFQSARLRFTVPPEKATANLGIYWYDPDDGVWVEVTNEKRFDPGTLTISAVVSHFSIYAVMDIEEYRLFLNAVANLSECAPRRVIVFDGSGSADKGDQVSNSEILSLVPEANRPAVVYTVSDTLHTIPTGTATTASDLDSVFGPSNVDSVIPLLDSLVSGDEAILVQDDWHADSAPLQGPGLSTSSIRAAIARAKDRGVLVFQVERAAILSPIALGIGLQSVESLDLQRERLGFLLSDFDEDGFTNCQERSGVVSFRSIDSRVDFASVARTNPQLNDTDADGLTDAQEMNPIELDGTDMSLTERTLLTSRGVTRIGRLKSDPTHRDGDHDEAPDIDETRGFAVVGPVLPFNPKPYDFKSDPLIPDTDDDGIDDGVETLAGTDPSNGNQSRIPGLTKPVIWLPGYAEDDIRNLVNGDTYVTADYAEVAVDPQRVPIGVAGEADLYELASQGKVHFGRFSATGRCMGPSNVCQALENYADSTTGRVACKMVKGNIFGRTWLPLQITCGRDGNGNVLANVHAQGLYVLRDTFVEGVQFFKSSRFLAYSMIDRLDEMQRILDVQRFAGPKIGRNLAAEAQIRKYLADASTRLASGGRIELPALPNETPPPRPAPDGDLAPTPEPATNLRIMTRGAARAEIARSLTGYGVSLGQAIDGVAMLQSLNAYTQARDVIYNSYWKPYAEVVAEEIVVTMREEQLETAESPFPGDAAVQEEIEKICAQPELMVLGQRIGSYPCHSRPWYFSGGKRFNIKQQRMEKMLQASQLRKDYWDGNVATGPGAWKINPAPADEFIHDNPGHILHYRPRVRNWWGDDASRPDAGTPGCPRTDPGTIQCDEFPSAASYEGGPYLERPDKAPAWLRGIAKVDNESDGHSYSQFLSWVSMNPLTWNLVNDARRDALFVYTWELPTLTFFQFPIVDEAFRSRGVRFVNGRAEVKPL